MTDYHSMAAYSVTITEKIRFSDTDRQGHVNNVCFSFFLEAGRSALLLETHELLDPGCSFVIVSTSIEFKDELRWPGHVQVANDVERIGNSSITLRQALFQDGRCVTTSISTMVQVNTGKHANQPLSQQARGLLAAMSKTGD